MVESIICFTQFAALTLPKGGKYGFKTKYYQFFNNLFNQMELHHVSSRQNST